jgi:H+/Cl- antiporter ClcA
MAGTLAMVGLSALFAHSVLDSLRDLEGPPASTSTPWWDNLWLLLLPFFLGVLVFLALFLLRYLALRRISPLRRSSKRRQGQR